MIDTKKPFNEFLMENKNQIIFIVPMRRLENMFGFIFASSSTKLEDVVCEIVEYRHKLSDNYKITLKAIDPAFGKDHYYLSDLQSMINDGRIKMDLKNI